MKTTKISLLTAAIFAASFFAIPPLRAADYNAGDITVEKPWARASFGTARPTAAYMTIHNGGTKDDALLGAESPLAGRVEIHESKMENGVMRMGPVAPLTVPAGQSVTMKPGGYHVMMMDLKTALAEGDMVSLTLMFRDAGKIEMHVPVEKAGAMQGGHGYGDDQHGGQMHGHGDAKH